jgi:hypothetical protein
MDTLKTADYIEALRQRLEVEVAILAKVLPHRGERGSNIEEYVRQLLRRILPTRFAVGTGFVIGSKSDGTGHAHSSQTDIVVYDQCSALSRCT